MRPNALPAKFVDGNNSSRFCYRNAAAATKVTELQGVGLPTTIPMQKQKVDFLYTKRLASDIYHLGKVDDSNDMDDNRLLDCSPTPPHFHVCSDTMAHTLFLHSSGSKAISTVDNIRFEVQYQPNRPPRYIH